MTGHIRQRGEHSWELKFDAGRDEHTGKRKIHYHNFKGTKKEAKLKLAELITAVSKGQYVERAAITVGEHVAARIAQWEALNKISPKTAERYRELLTNQIIPHIGGKALQKLKTTDVENWPATLMTRGRKDGEGGLSGRTIHHAHRLLSKALKDAVKHGIVIGNTAAAEQPPKVDAEEITILEAGDVKAVVEKLRGHLLYPIAIIALFAGLRRGELLALRWCDVDLDAAVITVGRAIEETRSGLRIKEPKTKSGLREVSMPAIVVDTLRAHRKAQLEQRFALGLGKLADDALLFCRLDGSLMSPRGLSRDWIYATRRLGLPRVKFHSLRHTHASHLIHAGIDVVKISKRLGHSKPTITLNVYAHLFQRRDDQSRNAIDAAVSALLD
jgi:integrase